MQRTWISMSAAVGIGLLIGLERERRKSDGPRRIPAGIRTFTIVALLGAASSAIDATWMLPATTLALAALLVAAYACSAVSDPGMTTAAALLLTLVLGAMAMHEPEMAVSIGVVATIVLAARARLHAFVRQTITENEMRDGLALAAAALVVLPFIPDRYVGSLQAVNLRTTWTIVVLIMSVGVVGHITQRLVGAAWGLAAAGFASGFVSSVATIVAMGSRIRQSPAIFRGAVAGALMSCVATVIQLAAVVAASSADTLKSLAWPLLGAGAACFLPAAAFSLWASRERTRPEVLADHAFSFGKALTLAVTVTGMTWLSFVLQTRYGATGLAVGVAIAGFADAHSAAASVASMVASGKMAAHDAVFPILAALTTNAMSKALVALASGGARFGVLVAGGVTLQIAAAWAGALLLIP